MGLSKTVPRNNAEALRILSRRSKIAALVLRGTTNGFEIAERLGMDRGTGQRTVSRDLTAIKADWKLFAVQAIDEAKGRELAKLEALEAEYWLAWERSKIERQRSRTKKREGGPATLHEAEIAKEQRDGDPRFLDGVQDCIDKRCKIWGIYRETRELTGPGGGPIGLSFGDLTDAELDDRIRLLESRFSGRLGATGGAPSPIPPV